jgi:hypothetical protein
MNRQAPFFREYRQRIARLALFVRRAANSNDVLAAGQELLKHGFAERFLTVDNDTHFDFLLFLRLRIFPILGIQVGFNFLRRRFAMWSGSRLRGDDE